MAERVAIFNAALGHIGQGTWIANAATDRSIEAIACRRQYALCRDAMLAAFPWGFATRSETMATWPDPPPGSAYAYVRNPAFLAVRRLEAYENGPPVPWRVGGITTPQGDDVTLLLSDQPATHVVATRRVENEALFDAPFAEALSWRLAWAICKELSKDNATRQECWVLFNERLLLAQVEDQKQAWKPVGDGELFEARQGLSYGLAATDAVTAARTFPVA